MKQYQQPNNLGYFGEYGGSFVPDVLKKSLDDLANMYEDIKHTKEFKDELSFFYKEYAGRPSNLYYAKNLTDSLQGAKIYLKREDMNHTGAHKINNCLGQALLAKRLKKKKLIAETGAGQHGVATATVAAYFGMKCDIYMGNRDIDAQKPNVFRMKTLGANVIPVSKGQGTLKDAVDVALNEYVKDLDSYYLLGSAVGPHPYPMIVRDFQKIIGKEIKKQCMQKEGRLPYAVIACVGGGSNGIGAFYHFINDTRVKLIAVEPEGKGKETNKHGLSLQKGTVGVVHGFKTLVLQDRNGNVKESYSQASGLDYPGVGPELAYLKDQGRIDIVSITDEKAVKAFFTLSQTEGIIPALESAHAIAYAIEYAKKLTPAEIIIVNLSGRGDKDVENIMNCYNKKI